MARFAAGRCPTHDSTRLHQKGSDEWRACHRQRLKGGLLVHSTLNGGTTPTLSVRADWPGDASAASPPTEPSEDASRKESAVRSWPIACRRSMSGPAFVMQSRGCATSAPTGYCGHRARRSQGLEDIASRFSVGAFLAAAVGRNCSHAPAAVPSSPLPLPELLTCGGATFWQA